MQFKSNMRTPNRSNTSIKLSLYQHSTNLPFLSGTSGETTKFKKNHTVIITSQGRRLNIGLNNSAGRGGVPVLLVSIVLYQALAKERLGNS